MSICFSQDANDDDFDEWDVIHKWRLNQTFNHQNFIEYTSVEDIADWSG